MTHIRRTLFITLISSLCIACSQESQKSTVKVAYVDLETEAASTSVFKLVLEDAGFQVQLEPMQTDKMWETVATGKADGMISAWLPRMHDQYYAKYVNDIDDLGPNLEGTRVGLIVPEYTQVLNIYELANYPEQFNNRIFGIEPKTGIMEKTSEAIKKYKLDYFLIDSTEQKIISMLQDAIAKEQWIVVTGWAPHWIFYRWHLQFLDDPENIYGEPGTINTIVRKNLQKEQPHAWQVFKNFYWEPEEMESLMLMIHDNPGKNEEVAKKWLENHPKLKARWLWKVKYSWLTSWIF